jgi:tRNA-binding protein
LLAAQESGFKIWKSGDREMTDLIDIEKLAAVDIRVGTIVGVASFPEARKPAWKLSIDLGPEIGLKNSSAQVTDLYAQDTLVGQQVACVVNLPARRIGPFVSEILTLGFPDGAGRVVLVRPERPVPNGGRLY